MAISERDLAKVRIGDVLLFFTEKVEVETNAKGKKVAVRHRIIKQAHVVDVRHRRGVVTHFVVAWGGGKRAKKENVSRNDLRTYFRRFAPEWLRMGRGKDASFECYHCGETVESMEARKRLARGAGHGPTCAHPRAVRYRKLHAQLRLFP